MSRNPDRPRRSIPIVRGGLGALLLAVALGVLTPNEASAQGGFFGAGVGPAIRIDDAPNQFRLELEIGYYVEGRPRGFFLSFAPAQSYGADWWILTFPLRLGGVFDIVRNRDFTFQIGPTGTVGFAVSDRFDSPRDPDPWFHFSFGLALRFLVLQEKLAFYLRPVDFEFFIGDTNPFGNEMIRYVLVGGVQFYF
ncbi:MAG TPA: hypothetical protein RMH99_11695 [Sandaracinaceae bacterium LLY-WYZ-13_1]|nr:hypothetical protein [Sandaracinaceae bacterium LLY-WYZ-13_1]